MASILAVADRACFSFSSNTSNCSLTTCRKRPRSGPSTAWRTETRDLVPDFQ